jgi:ABC-type bacteriocin/lantibiotic exporter with double-glycine peptidase domain
MVQSGDDPRSVTPRTLSIPWRRAIGLLRPIRGGVAAMMTLSITGVLVGLVPPLALGVLVDALIERNDRAEAAVLTVVILAAIVIGATAYVLSDGMYARNAGRLYLNLRTEMFAGALRRARNGGDTAGIASRFISDAETLEQITLYLFDTGSMLVVGFATALVAIGVLQPWSVVVVTPALAGIWVITRRIQKPVGSAGQRRQEELERMTNSIVRELARPGNAQAGSSFRAAAERVRAAEVRLGWLRALNLQGSGGLANIGPISVVVAAAFLGTRQIGALISLYLLAQRVFWGFDGLVDLSLGMNSVRGAVARCFELIDTANDTTTPQSPISVPEKVGT